MTKSRKLPMVKRETAEQRSVSFTKRRHGLFNKAAQLCMLCNSQIAILVSSPFSKTKIFSFGHSSVDVVLEAFLSGCAPQAVDNAYMDLAVSLSEEIKALESDIKACMQNRKRRNPVPDGDSSWGFKGFENSNSIKGLNLAIRTLESLIEKGKNKLNIESSSSPNLALSSASTSDATTSCVGSNPSTSTTPGFHDYLSMIGESLFGSINYNCDNVVSTGGNVGNDQLICYEPAGDNTGFDGTPSTIPCMGSGFVHEADNVFPTVADDPLSHLQFPCGSNYKCNSLFPVSTRSTNNCLDEGDRDADFDIEALLGVVNNANQDVSAYDS